MSPDHMLLHHFTLYNLKIKNLIPWRKCSCLNNNSTKSISLKVWSPEDRKVHVSQRGKDPLSGSKDLCTGELTSVSGSGREMVMGGLSGK